VYNERDDDRNVANTVYRSDDGNVANTVYRSDDGNVANTVYRSDDGNVAHAVYRSDDGNVANSVLYNGNANKEYDVINDADVDTYEEIATGEDGVGVYNEIFTDALDYAEVDIRPSGVHNEGSDIYNELQDTYGTNQSTEKHIFSISSGFSRLSSLSVLCYCDTFDYNT
jgi:hypothetical protein